MIIRKATLEDLDQCIPMINDFYLETFADMNMNWVEGTAKVIAEQLVKDHLFFVADKDGDIIGGIGGYIVPCMLDITSKMFQEVSWFVKEEHRSVSVSMKLFNEVEKHCMSNNIDYVMMGNLGNYRDLGLKKFYERKGYIHFETTYIKKIGE